MINTAAFGQITRRLQAKGVRLIAVSKFKPVEDIRSLYELGQRDFGENYVQELVAKQEQLPEDIQWHFIGHLQRNKVKYIAPFVHLIHSVDSFKLLTEINKEAAKHDRNISCLLQMHVTGESTKTGMNDKELLEFYGYYEAQKGHLKNVTVKGIMGMATFTEDQNQVRKDFQQLKSIFDSARKSYFLFDHNFDTLSMGMSGDYELALQEGSTMVRIGSLLFGSRSTI
ncbi:MAG TPA: YggS family pyridoxal phosphate-dependent enzyme [Edaphocola sp.]|nr:YggS family pyridoxal phosphate-dependent enzyme [Edaphocola sp.]